jgi:hypothetical protein
VMRMPGIQPDHMSLTGAAGEARARRLVTRLLALGESA